MNPSLISFAIQTPLDLACCLGLTEEQENDVEVQSAGLLTGVNMMISFFHLS